MVLGFRVQGLGFRVEVLGIVLQPSGPDTNNIEVIQVPTRKG